MSQTSPEIRRRWNEKHYDRLVVLVPKGRQETIRQYVEERGTSVNGLINELLRYELGLTKKEWVVRAQA